MMSFISDVGWQGSLIKLLIRIGKTILGGG